jgi:hypothetical protein
MTLIDTSNNNQHFQHGEIVDGHQFEPFRVISGDMVIKVIIVRAAFIMLS